jgi:replication-associated recombination protein RarA
MIPSTFRPILAADFIGPARRWAVHLEKLVALALPAGDPLRLMFLGQSGVGKSQLAEFFVRLTGAGRFSVSKFNGASFRIDDAEEIGRQYHYKDFFGGYRVLQIEEVDKVPTLAQVRLLSILDEMPNHTACIVTSNCELKLFEVRFQRRFTVCEIGPPTDEELIDFLRLHWSVIPKKRCVQIATFALGNVGLALADADNSYAEFAL